MIYKKYKKAKAFFLFFIISSDKMIYHILINVFMLFV